MKDWNLRYAAEMDEETLNRLIPTTSSEFGMNPNDWGYSPYSAQKHSLDKPIGNLDHIITFVHKNPKVLPPHAFIFGNKSTKPTEWEDQANEALQQHFAEEPIDLPNKVVVHHPDNHQHILHRVKKWVANQV